MDKISIIIPCYNIENYIENTVDSICNQSYTNLEIILVDDGSIDGTLDKLNQLQKRDWRIRVIHKENGGVTSARLCGVEEATGEWIGFVDGDDYIEPDMYTRLIHNAIKYQADISHCGYQMVFPSHIDYYYNTGRIVEQDNIVGLIDLLSGTFVEPGLGNKIYHRNILQSMLQEQKMDFTIKNMEDLLMNFYLFQKAQKSIYEDFCPYHYMLRKGSAATSSINENKLRGPMQVFKIIEEEVKDNDILANIIARRMISLQINHATLSYGKQRELIHPYRITARQELRKKLLLILRGNYSIKQKIMVFWVVVCPASYNWIHSVYEKITKNDKKYEVK